MTANDPPEDLSLVPIQYLYTEILNRFDHVVIVGLKSNKDDRTISRRWKGSHHMVMGLCQDVSQLVGADWYKNQEKIETDEL